MTTKRLTDRAVRAAKPGKHHDGGGHGLMLVVGGSGRRSWVQRVKIRGRKHPRELGLGSYPLVSLAAAREKARENTAMAREGRDPKAEREREQASELTLEQAARIVHALGVSGWSAGHAHDWITALELHVFPGLGARPVGEIDAAAVAGALAKVWVEKPVTARRVAMALSQTFPMGDRAWAPPRRPDARGAGAAPPREDAARPDAHGALRQGAGCARASPCVLRPLRDEVGLRVHGAHRRAARRGARRDVVGDRLRAEAVVDSGRAHEERARALGASERARHGDSRRGARLAPRPVQRSGRGGVPRRRRRPDLLDGVGAAPPTSARRCGGARLPIELSGRGPPSARTRRARSARWRSRTRSRGWRAATSAARWWRSGRRSWSGGRITCRAPVPR